MFFKWLYIFIAFFLKILFRVKMVGKENIPKDGPLLICPNHTSNIDPFFATLFVKGEHKFRFMAKSELFKNKFFGALLLKLGAFPVERGTNDIKSIKTAMTILKSQSERMIIFPEGTVSKTGKLLAGKPGVGMFTLRSGVSVLPCYISSKKKFFHRVYVVAGEVMHFSNEGVKPTPDDYKRVSDQIMAAIGALSDACPNF